MTESPRPDPNAAVRAAYAAVEDILTFTPVQTNRIGGWTPARQRMFIGALAVMGTVEGACRSVGLTVQGAYKLRKRPDAVEFALAWNEAVMRGRDRAYALAVDRALNGYTRSRFYRGRQVGTVHQFDNRMVMHALNAPALPRQSDRGAAGMGGGSSIPLSAVDAYLADLEARITFERAMASLVPEFDEEGTANGEGDKV